MKAATELTVLIALLATAQGLTCHKCLGTRENCTDSWQVCSSNETVCVEETRAAYGPISETLKRGCSTLQYCQSYFSVRRGFISRSIYCCSGDLCNLIPYNVTYSKEHNGVECYSCIGSLEECGGAEIPTAQCRGKENNCVEISRQWLPETGSVEPIIKGCADYPKEEMLLAYSIGSRTSYAAIRVCEGSKCNNRSFTELPVGELNGLACYSCLDAGNGECYTENLQPMNCTGTMDRCMTITDYVRHSRIRAGCANQQLCRPTAFYGALMPKLPASYVACCQGPFCNGGQAQGPRRGWGVLLALLVAPLLIALD
ncbi:urokinase plasminogen activator surface receptor-like [Hemicordylus capensis]|uniref:urokinase plasminogen activator surface receptor-like n=1 Tax=Hemicordylus capensis TaxID=884348 RepID=UPI00230456E8|nr:urokinase plasminogen activator surface receptor-like [Hemicordylus capensis]